MTKCTRVARIPENSVVLLYCQGFPRFRGTSNITQKESFYIYDWNGWLTRKSYIKTNTLYLSLGKIYANFVNSDVG